MFLFKNHDVLKDIMIISCKLYTDDRGFFTESFHKAEFMPHYIDDFVQENHSYSNPPCFRGLHYQLNPRAQNKFVYCVTGNIIDFAVDIRKGSPTYGKFAEIELSSGEAVYIPSGFAHGFLAHGVNPANVIYKVSKFYSKEHERCIKWNDPQIGIKLPASNIAISDKDDSAPFLTDAENNFIF